MTEQRKLQDNFADDFSMDALVLSAKGGVVKEREQKVNRDTSNSEEDT